MPQCAPELNIAVIACDPALQPPPAAGHAVHRVPDSIDLIGTITQVTPGNRVAPGERRGPASPGHARHRVRRRGRGPGRRRASATELGNTGVPFIFVDRGVRNSLRYFYAVTAFDVNSLVSGPSSLESARVTKAGHPGADAQQPGDRRPRWPRTWSGRDVSRPTPCSRMPTIDRGHRAVQRPDAAGERRRGGVRGRVRRGRHPAGPGGRALHAARQHARRASGTRAAAARSAVQASRPLTT